MRPFICFGFGSAVAVLVATFSLAARAQTVVDAPMALPAVPMSNGGWTNYLRLDDLNNDGDLDIVIPSCGGFFTSPSAQPFVLLGNDGAANFELSGPMLGIDGNKPVRVAAIGDIDGDGDNDVFLPSAGGTPDELYVFDGTSFVDQSAELLPGGGTNSVSAGARFGDVDGDGDLDLLVAQRYTGSSGPPARLFLNDGTGAFTDSATLPSTLLGSNPDDVDFIDIDRDFDLDIMINTHSGGVALWRNDGTGTFTDVSANFPGPVSGPFAYGPSACDVDGDGDLDVWRDNVGGGSKREQLLINDGSGNYTDESDARIIGNPDSDDNGVWCVDIDLDGDFDGVVAALFGPERILINDGTGVFTYQSGGFPNVSDCTLWMDWGDLNGDGRLDVVTGQGECGNTKNQLYLGNNNMPVDTRAPEITHAETLPASVMANANMALRFAVKDQVVTDSGPRLNRAFLKVSFDNGATTEVTATFMGGDLFRAQLPTNGGMEATVTPCAVDRQDNEGCGVAQIYSIEGGMATTTTATGSGGGAPAGSGGASASSGNGGEGGDFELDEGCGCRVAGDGSSKNSWSALLLALGLGGLAFGRRRRTVNG